MTFSGQAATQAIRQMGWSWLGRAAAVSLALALLVLACALTGLLPVSGQEGSVTTPPARPTGLSASAAAHDSIALTWDDPGDAPITHYEVFRRDTTIHAIGEFITLVEDTGSAETTYTDSTVEAERKYVYRVKAVNAAGASQWSSFANATTPPAPVPVIAAEDLAPTGLTATPVDGSGVSLSWTAPAEDAGSVTGYEILRGVGAGTLSTLVSDSGNTTTSYTDSTATTAAETYAYQVKAIRGEDRSQASSEASIELPAVDPPPTAEQLAPSGLTATPVGGGGVSLSWSAPAEDAESVTGYEILRSEDGRAFTTLVADTGSGATAYTDLTADQVGTIYGYRVIALRGSVKSELQSNEVSVELRQVIEFIGDVPEGCASTDTACSGTGPADLAVAETALGLLLSWNPPPTPSGAGFETELVQYEIERSPGDDSYSLLTCGDSAARSYLDASAELRGQYRYRVRAIYFVNEACAALRDIDVDLTIDGVEYEPVDGLWSDGTTLWASDAARDRMLAFRLSDGLYDSGNDIVAEDGSSPRGLWGREGDLWALSKTGPESTPMALDGFSLAEATFGDRTGRIVLGHDADESGAPEAGYGVWGDADAFWVTALQTSLLAYDWAASGTLSRNTAKELSPGIPNSEFATSMWGDGTTMWMATPIPSPSVAAINWPAGTADTSKDITLRSDHGTVGGMWSDGEIIWIASGNDDLFAYPLSQTRQHSAWTRGNRAPVVAVTPATAVVAGSGTLKPSVTASDPEQDDLTYAWTSDGGGTFNDSAIAGAKWIAPAATDSDRTITLTLTVSDALSETTTATLVVTVPASTSGAPSAAATAVPAIVDGRDTVLLGGTAADPQGDGLSYAWTSSGGGTFGKDAAIDTTWTAPAATSAEQRFTLTLTATDDSSDANRSVSTLVVIVRAELRNPFLRQVANQAATGEPRILAVAEGGPFLHADTLDIRDGNGVPHTGSLGDGIDFSFTYQWLRSDADGSNEANIGADSVRYQLVDADVGKLIKVQVSYTDQDNHSESLTSAPFGPIVRPDPLGAANALVRNTGENPGDVVSSTITKQYATEFNLGSHGQGYELSSVSVELAGIPSKLTVSLWIGAHPGGPGSTSVPHTKLFDFTNPDSFAVGLNEFTAPAGQIAYQKVGYWIVLSDFGSSLSIKESTSDFEAPGGESGATIGDNARVRSASSTGQWKTSTERSGGGVLRMAINGSRRESGILASTFAQPHEGDQQTISIGDNCCFRMGSGTADRYLIRGFSWAADDTTPVGGGISNPFYVVDGTKTDGDNRSAKLFRLANTRNTAGVTEWSAPPGATVPGGSSKTYTFWQDLGFLKYLNNDSTRFGNTFTRIAANATTRYDGPFAQGVSLAQHGDIEVPVNPVATVIGVPLDAMVSNLGRDNNGTSTLGGTDKVLSQGFTTGSEPGGYRLQGIGVNVEGSGNRVPDNATTVSVAVHIDSSGKPGAKLFDLISPGEYAAGELSFFEAPRGTRLEPSTDYVLVWTHNAGAEHRLQRTLSDGEDAGALAGFSIANAHYLGADTANLSVDSGGYALEIALYTLERALGNATGRPVVLMSAEGPGILAVDTWRIADVDGLPYIGEPESGIEGYVFAYEWTRVDSVTAIETQVGGDSQRYQLVEADFGHLIKVHVSFVDQKGTPERLTSPPFGPIAEPGPPLSYPTTLVGNTAQTPSATADISTAYAMGFKLGKHGQGYEISSVMIDLAAIPSSLTVSLWTGGALGGSNEGTRGSKLFEFTNPSSFQVGLNEFSAPAGLSAYQNVPYWIVLSDFGGSLSIRETTSNAQDAGGETGATLADSAGGDSSVLRLAIEGSRRTSGILAANFTFEGGNQEIVSVGDDIGQAFDLGPAERYLFRGVTWNVDDSTPQRAGFVNPYWLRRDSFTGDRLFDLVITRDVNGQPVWTAPQGSTLLGSKTYVFDHGDFNVKKQDDVDRVGAVLSRYQYVGSAGDGKEDQPTAPGVNLPKGRGLPSGTVDNSGPTPLMALHGEPLVAMVQNLGRTDNGHVSLGAADKVLSQGFTTGVDAFGYRLQGIGFELSSDSHLPDDSASVSVSLHADLGGRPGEKLLDLISPTDYAADFSFFEAPPRTYLDPSTSYVLVWTHNAGSAQRLRRTAAAAEDAGARTGALIANVYYLGADLGSLSADAGNALEIAVYAEVLDTAPGELVVLGPTVALVSNVRQTAHATPSSVVSSSTNAQAFSTGSEAAILESVEAHVNAFSDNVSVVSVAIHTEESGVPGTKVYDLIIPSTIGTGAQKFTAPGGATLEANTTYFVVFSVSTGVSFKINTTASGAEDSGGVEGWSIGDQRLSAVGSSWNTLSRSLMIRVNGRFRSRPTRVDPGWALVPEALVDAGGYFRLLFMTSTETAATSTDIDTYNSFAQTRAAAGHDAIQEYSAGFRAVASTAAIDAVSNTATTGSRVPIYWLDGTSVADNYRDFYDASWDDEQNPTNESGNVEQPTSVWTGSTADGTKGVHDTHGATVLGGGDRTHAAYGTLNSATIGPLSGNTGWREIARPLYGISEVFTVDPNPALIKRLAITSNPRSGGSYRPGEAIEVTATFGAALQVQGEPRIQLHLGQSDQSRVWADYVSGGALILDGLERILIRNQRGLVIDTQDLDSTTSKAAQAFTTGAEADGYRLDSIGFFFAHMGDDSTAAAHLTVTLNQDDNGDPGAVLCTLSDPTSFPANALSVFDASPCDTLAANTTYFVVLERVTFTADRITPALSFGDLIGINFGGLNDWSIAYSSHAYASGSWSETTGRFYQIGITGSVVVPVLVSNTGIASHALMTDILGDAGDRKAQAFTTGSEPHGYLLGSISVKFDEIAKISTAGRQLTATLNAVASDGNPAASLCRLDDPPSFSGSGAQTFAASGNCPPLERSTTYFVVIERVQDDGKLIDLSLVSGNNFNEDSGAAAGWSIGNGRYAQVGGGSWTHHGAVPFQIEVNGVAAEAGYSPDQLVFSYTVRAGVESDSDGVQIGVSGTANAIEQDLGGSITLARTALDAVLDFGPTDSFSGHRVNWERPSLVDAVSSADGRRLHLTFSEELNPQSAPSNSHFTVMVDSEPVPLRGTTAAVAARVVTLTLLTPIASARHLLTVAYRDSPGDDEDAVEDREGNDANGFRARVAPNRYGIKAELLPDSPLVPEGLEVGDQFRLLFLSSTKRDAISSNIETYNAFVQAAAAIGRRDIREYRTGFLAVASTAAVNARNNTATTGSGVPIYWLRGAKIADHYDDFYDGDWQDEANPTDESGEAIKIDGVWTGSAADGTKGLHNTHGATVLGGGNRSHAAYGRLNSATIGPLSGNTGWREIERPLYALSEVFTVVSPAAIETVEISSDPGSDGNYATGDDISVALTFGNEVDVSGNPSITIRLGEDASTERTAYFDSDVLVKNTAQAPFSGSPLNAATPRFAQRFTTGNIPGGYRLSEIGIRFHTIEHPASADDQLTVSVNRDNSGAPGSVHCALTTPARLRSNELSRFTAPGSGCTLSVETDYYVVIQRTTISADTIAVWTTASADEDASRLEDWSISDRGHIHRGGGWSPAGAPFMIKVGGELSDTDIYQPKVLLSNVEQTLQGEFSPLEGQESYAALFNTGPSSHGYRLQSIGFRMGEITDTSTVGGKVRVTLNADQLYPGYELCTLSPPDSFTENAVNRFGASSCPALAPNTDYFVHFERVNFDASEDIEFSTTGSFGYDAAEAGWSFFHYTYAYGLLERGVVGWTQSEADTAYRVEISGRALLPSEQPEPPDPPAEARKQVANTGQSGLVSAGLTSSLTKHAQAFTTGAHANGYLLDTLGIGFGALAAAARAKSELFAHLHEGGGDDPGTLLCTMHEPISFRQNAVSRFPNWGACPVLTPNTTYFVVVEREAFNLGTIETTAYTSDNENAARPGWSIADDSRVYDGSDWSSGGGSSLAIDIRAVDIPSEEDLRPTGTVEELVAGPVGKLVSNHAGPDTGTFSLGNELDKLAQAFTTGPNTDGYRLSSLGFALYDFANIASLNSKLVVSLNTANGVNPGETLCSLDGAQFFTIGGEPMLRFYPPATSSCPALEPSTTYFGVIEDVSDGTLTASTASKDGGAEDEDSAPGWSIAYRSRYVLPGETAWGGSDPLSRAGWGFEVRGAELGPPPSVKNFEQPIQTLQEIRNVGTKVGQGFTTGDHELGYALSSIGIGISNWKEASQLAVTLNADNNGVPGDALCTLNSPASLTSVNKTLDAPISCPRLTTETTYYVVAELLMVRPGQALSFRHTASGDEDSDSAPDWSIADFATVFGGVSWNRFTLGIFYIEVKATPLQASLQVPSTPVVFSYTVEPSDESGPDGIAVGDPDSAGNTIALNDGMITIRRSGETFPLDYTALFADAEHRVNWARPRLVSAATSKDGKRVRLTFSEHLGRSGRPPTSLFTLKVDGRAAALTGLGIDAAVVESDTWTVDAPLEAAQSWPFTPAGLSAGDQFRLLFLTSTTRDATSSIIDDYNSFVQDAAAAGDADIQDYSHGFYAVASTADDDARDNTQTTYTSSDEGVPIYWLGGNKLADDYEDFYDGLWPENAEANPTNESGVVNSELPRPQFVWTGSADDGTAYHSPVLGSNNTLSRAMGTSEAFAVVGWIRSPPYGPLEPNPISGGSTKPKIDPYPLYALSLPFVVSATVVEPPAADELQLVDSVVTLELVTPLTSADQVVTISYDDPRLRDDTNVIEDLVGNDARSFTNRPVLNRFAFSPPAVEAPADWALIPPGLPAGAPFRLLFVTSGARDASSAYIEDYDDFVQSAAAAGHKLIRPYSDGFFALASTPDMDARDNTSTTGTGVPIYWLGGAKAADNYADFYDESWDDELNPQDEFGERRDVSARADFPWTGSNHNGTERVEANVSYALGAEDGSDATVGMLDESDAGVGPINGTAGSVSEHRPLYALSQVFVVEAEDVPTGSAIIPPGLAAGDRFRLLFLSSGTRDATSSDIEDYNRFIQQAAATGHGGIQGFSDGFRAVASTPDIDAPENTWTTGEGVPIYWLGGDKLADDYADFYDGSWDAEAQPTDESGKSRPITADADSPWTGSNHDGAEEVSRNRSHGLGGDASTGTVIGMLNAEVPGDGPLDADLKARSEARPIYGISPVLAVRDDRFAPPIAPANLTVTPGDQQVLLRWTAPDVGSGPPITRYEYQQDGSVEWISTGGSTTSYLVTGLDNGREYTFRVRAVNVNGSGSASAVSLHVTPGTQPGAPTNLTAEASNAAVDLRWDAPDAVGGGAITHYEYEQGRSENWVSTASDATSFTVITDIEHDVLVVNGVSYTFRVRAVNQAGWGPASNRTDPVTPATQPDAPTLTSALGGDDYVALVWEAPIEDSGRPISHYEYELENSGSWISTGSTATRLRVTGLQNGTSYRFRVRAVNELGGGTASNTLMATPTADPTPPSRPTNLVARAGHESVTLSWNQAGAVVTDYQYQQNGATAWVSMEGTDNSFTVRGLDNRVLYRFRVRGINDDGEGPPSAEVQATPIAQPPDSPTMLPPENGDGQVTLTWRAPASDGGTAITHYQYEQNGNWHSTVPRDSTKTSYTVTGLTNDRTYRFRVQAFNDSGVGPSQPSNRVTATPTGPKPPDAPTFLRVEAGDRQVKLTWTEPHTDQGFPITRYEYERQDDQGNWISTGRSTGATVRGLENGIEYRFRVRAFNKLGSGLASSWTSATPATTPDAPTGLVAVAGDEEVTLTWTAPASDGGAEIDVYQYEQNSDGNWISMPSTDTVEHIVTGLVNGQRYTFRVRAINRVGPGAASRQSDRVTPARTADAPTGLSALSGDGFVDLEWTAPVSDGGAPIMRYEYEQDGSATWVSTGSAAASFRVSNLSNDQNHGFRTRAVNRLGASAESNFADATPTAMLTKPDPPTLHVPEPGHESVTLSWNQRGPIVTGYEYQLDRDLNWISTGGKSKTFTVTGLTNDQDYRFRVRAVNSDGTSDPSLSQPARPTAQPPDAPTALQARSSDGEVTLSWKAPKFDGGSEITRYELEQDGVRLPTPINDTNHTVTGLTNGDTYEFRVIAVNDVQESEPSALVRATPTEGPTSGGSGPRSSGGGGGGGGGGPPPIPIPSDEDFDWNVTRDIDALHRLNDVPTGIWSDGTLLWVVENAVTGADRVFAYDLLSGRRAAEREFEFDRRNRFSHGIWSDGETVWIADSGQDKLFAYELESGERVEARDLALAERNRDPRGIWSDGETIYVLDPVKDALFTYQLSDAEFIAEHPLVKLNQSPRGIWSDGVTIWVSDDGAKRLFAYELEDEELVRNDALEFTFRPLLKAGNSAPRGIWSDGEIMYVVDAHDDKVYSYNIPDAIIAKLADVQTKYEGGTAGLTTITPVPVVKQTTVTITPPDADDDPENGHQIKTSDDLSITVTVVSEDGSRTREYVVRLSDLPPPPNCLSELTEERLSTVSYVGGSVGQLGTCAREREIAALFFWDGRLWLLYALNAPEFLNQSFQQHFTNGLPVDTSLIANRPVAAEPTTDN